MSSISDKRRDELISKITEMFQSDDADEVRAAVDLFGIDTDHIRDEINDLANDDPDEFESLEESLSDDAS